MAVTYDKPVRVDEWTFVLRWTSDRTRPVPFRVFREGVMFAEFDSSDGEGEIYITAAPGEYPFVEVLDHADAVSSIAFPGRLTLYWVGVTGAEYYTIEEYVSSVWTARDTVYDNSQGAFSWLTRWLEDVTSHQFRITAVDEAGNDGTPLSFTCVMVRHPDTPSVSMALTGSRTVTISAA